MKLSQQSLRAKKPNQLEPPRIDIGEQKLKVKGFDELEQESAACSDIAGPVQFYRGAKVGGNPNEAKELPVPRIA